MNLKELAKKLDRISELQAKIEGEVRDTYKEHGELTAEVSLEIAARKGKELLGIDCPLYHSRPEARLG
jgi:hypothetical protein